MNSGGDSLAAAWAIQRRVIGALLMREILTRYGRHNIGFLWLFAEPMMFTLGVAALWTAAGAHRMSNLPIVAFALTGYSLVLLWRSMPTRCISAIEPNLSLLYHRNVKIADVFFARLILEAGGTTISFVILTLVFWLGGWIKPPEDVLQVACGWFMMGWFGIGLGLTMGVLSWKSEIIEKIWHPAAYLLFPLSGAAFLVDSLPPIGQDVVLLLPMVHATEFLREGFFGSVIRAHYDLTYMAAWNAGLSVTGLLLLRSIASQVRPE
ncbi:sugar ABC transporter permease [Sandarakinorhabdus cyanobacteriorum]|uniref:Sugar ABC transporter permease n=1 Tax=Sandarakinorhabdus cyanobacteriorum TaxID=1981098 RepID=A0A255Y7B9_9SPHN|nr:ABC transporter permease [Sandarakinorhabdus cyanobacteriorum]OYQ25071.1 sugar ABC transporter permease [Sandarakinorhabdus cyanobacteriorum]